MSDAEDARPRGKPGRPRNVPGKRDQVLASLSGVPPSAKIYRRLSVSEIGATKGGIHTTCSVCGHVEAVDDRTIRAGKLNRAHSQIGRRAGNRAQEWFTNGWGWQTFKRKAGQSGIIRSRGIANVFLTGAGRFLRHIYRRAKRTVKGPWFAVAMHGDDSFGQQLFVCPLNDLFTVLEAIGHDSPEFRNRLLSASRNVNGLSLNELEHPGKLGESGDNPKLLLDDASTVWIE